MYRKVSSAVGGVYRLRAKQGRYNPKLFCVTGRMIRLDVDIGVGSRLDSSTLKVCEANSIGCTREDE